MSDELEFTGERFTPECVREIWYEHVHRYAFARSLAPGRRVLDAACGEGYGSRLLSEVAESVLGVDIDGATIEHARKRYGQQANLSFQQGDVTALDELPDNAFDLIACFETLEHVRAQESMLAGFVRMLAPGGVLLVSSPDKAEYSDRCGFENEFHVRELYRSELESLLEAKFVRVRLLAQKLLFQSVLWTLDGEPENASVVTGDDDGLHPGLQYRPMYYLAICSQQALPQMPGLHLFGDAAESVYDHYNGEVRKNMAAGQRIAELELRNRQFERRLQTGGSWWRRLFGRH